MQSGGSAGSHAGEDAGLGAASARGFLCAIFLIVVKYQSHEIYHFNSSSARLSGTEHIHMVVPSSRPSSSRTFIFFSKTETLDPLDAHGPSPSPWQPPSVAMDLTTLQLSQQWNHTGSVLL